MRSEAAIRGFQISLAKFSSVSGRGACGRPDIFPQNSHVLNRCLVVQDAAPQRELAANTRIREVAAPTTLELYQNAFVECVQIASVTRWVVTETEDGKRDWREQLKVGGAFYEVAEIPCASDIALDGPRDIRCAPQLNLEPDG